MLALRLGKRHTWAYLFQPSCLFLVANPWLYCSSHLFLQCYKSEQGADLAKESNRANYVVLGGLSCSALMWLILLSYLPHQSTWSQSHPFAENDACLSCKYRYFFSFPSGCWWRFCCSGSRIFPLLCQPAGKQWEHRARERVGAQQAGSPCLVEWHFQIITETLIALKPNLSSMRASEEICISFPF